MILNLWLRQMRLWLITAGLVQLLAKTAQVYVSERESWNSNHANILTHPFTFSFWINFQHLFLIAWELYTCQSSKFSLSCIWDSEKAGTAFVLFAKSFLLPRRPSNPELWLEASESPELLTDNCQPLTLLGSQVKKYTIFFIEQFELS